MTIEALEKTLSISKQLKHRVPLLYYACDVLCNYAVCRNRV